MPKLRYDLSDMPDAFTDLTIGKYPGKLIACVKGKSKASGNPMLIWDWTILAGPDKGQKARTWTSLQEQALGGLKQHLLALGFKKSVNVDTDELLGKKVVLVIGQRSREIDGKTTMVTQVTGVLPPKDAEEDSDDDEEEAPKPKKKAAKDEDDEDEEEDRPKKKKKPADDDDDDDDEEPF